MPEVIDRHVDAMVNLNLVSYHRGMQNALDRVAEELALFRQPFAEAAAGIEQYAPYTQGLMDGMDSFDRTVRRLKAKSARLCHESRGEHECDEYCPPPF